MDFYSTIKNELKIPPFTFIYVSRGVETGVVVCMWRWENSLCQSILSLLQVDWLQDQTEVIRLAAKSPLLTEPGKIDFWKIQINKIANKYIELEKI